MPTTKTKPEEIARAPRVDGGRTATNFRMRNDVKAWLSERGRQNGRSAAAEMETILVRAMKRDGRTS